MLPVGLMLRGSWNNVEALAGYSGPGGGVRSRARRDYSGRACAQRWRRVVPQAKFQLIPGGHNDWSQQPQVSIRNP